MTTKNSGGFIRFLPFVPGGMMPWWGYSNLFKFQRLRVLSHSLILITRKLGYFFRKIESNPPLLPTTVESTKYVLQLCNCAYQVTLRLYTLTGL